jgi:hypothetical protein
MKEFDGKERRFRLPRLWSNIELKKIAHHFTGGVVNVSAWKDEDKEGAKYESYFNNASSYYVTNHPTLPKGYQQSENEILLDLEAGVPEELHKKFSVVLNHTVLEHVYDFHKAVETICLMSNDIVITVVPFMQQMHGFYDEGGYGDYWRFTPLALQRMFERHGFTTIYQSYNMHDNASVYVFHVCSRFPENWKTKMPPSIPYKDSKLIGGYPAFIGSNMILSEPRNKGFFQKIKKLIRKP